MNTIWCSSNMPIEKCKHCNKVFTNFCFSLLKLEREFIPLYQYKNAKIDEKAALLRN